MEAKPVIVAGAFVGIVIVVVVLFTSFQAGWDNNPGGMPMKAASMINLENGSPPLGLESAPITIVKFGDYQCEACYHWFHNTRSTLIDNYIETGKAKLVFVDLPFLGRDSPKAAHASYCAEAVSYTHLTLPTKA